MKTLAIHGHPTRGNEVIKILEMLGGENKATLSGNGLYIYYIDCNNCIDLSSTLQDKFITFHLEEFLEKYPYKVGDMVQYKGSTSCRSIYKIVKMIWKADQIHYIVYNPWQEYDKCTITAEYLQPYKEETKNERKYPELRLDPSDDDKLATEATWDGIKMLPPDGYLIGKITEVDNGLLVEFAKKQPQYPKTYEECCQILHTSCSRISTPGYRECQISLFQELIICRDAYWKIAGKQMGLSGSWAPDLTDIKSNKYAITNAYNGIKFELYGTYNGILVFPTKEIRDIFFKNFKNLIEKCKEFL